MNNNYNEVSKYLDIMIKTKASDMFLTYLDKPSFRINKKILRNNNLETLDDNILQKIAKNIDSNANLDNIKKWIDKSINYLGRQFRINISLQQNHIMIVIRLLMKEIPELSSIGEWETINNLIKKQNWLIVVSGSSGSGKTTLLASMIQEINKSKTKHIISIEDPIEYIIKSEKSIVEQKELWQDIANFSDALKMTMRQNPDIIVFGEIRDRDSLENALILAETWHLVITTTHAKSAGQTINKMISLFDGQKQNYIREQLSENIVAVINQKMMNNIDYSDIVIAQEIMINNTAISNGIRKNDLNAINNTISTSSDIGMISMEKQIKKLFDKWLISKEVAEENINKF